MTWHLVAVLILPFPNPDASLRASWRAFIVFTTYDIHGCRAAGIFRFPATWIRSPIRRWTLLVSTLVIIGFGFGMHCPSPFSAMQAGESFLLQALANFTIICIFGPLVLISTLWLCSGTLLARFEKELSTHCTNETTDWDNYIDRIINSNDDLESDHLLLGTSEVGDYPILLHREILNQHVHILGDSGSSKTALAMAPQATQLIARADSTVVIIDLKGDKALFESCRREAARTGQLRFRWISNEVGKTTYGFNPFLQSHNSKLHVEQLTQQILQGLSLDYGIEYGAGYYTAMNEIVMNTLMLQTGARSFAEQMAYVAASDRMSAAQLAEVASRIESLKSKAKSLVNPLSPSPLNAGDLAEVIDLHNASKQSSDSWKLALQQALAIKHKLTKQFVPVAPESKQPVTVGDKIADAAATAMLEDLDEQIEREAADKILERAKAEEEQALVVEATKPEVVAVLSPLLAHRNLQPREMAGTTLRFKKTVDKMPISLSALQGINALADSEAGLTRLATLGGHWQLTEPRWSVKSQARYWTDEDRELLKKAQELLRVYGPILVQQGLLSP